MDVHKTPLLAVFGSKQRLEVPLFQRQYVWNEEHQWLPLWEDIERKFTETLEARENAPVHFLGAMVLDQKQTPTGHVVVRQVIDGQEATMGKDMVEGQSAGVNISEMVGYVVGGIVGRDKTVGVDAPAVRANVSI